MNPIKALPKNVFPRRLDKALPEAADASGNYIEDIQGRRYLDASGGAIVVNVGHGRKEIARAVYDQILRHDYVHPTMFSSEPVEKLSEALAGHAPGEIDRFYTLTSGSEAIEAAIKLARQIHIDAGRPEKFRLISRWKSYHGLTMGALSAMGRTEFRAPYAPMLHDAVHIPPPYCLRCAYGLAYPACGVRCALALEETVENMGPETVSAFLAETVSGGTLAAAPPPAEYFSIIRRICDRYDILLILDEVMCGMGRTGRWFACEHYHVIPDIVTLGKGLSGGVLPLSAFGVKSEHFDAIASGSGRFVHGGTYSHHPVSASAGLATIRIIEKEGLVDRVARMAPVLENALRDAIGDHPHVAEIRGIGFLWGVELVKDRSTNRPFPRKQKTTERVLEAIADKGVLVYGTTRLAGADGDGFLVSPPYTVSEKEIAFAAEAIQKGLDEVLGSGHQIIMDGH